MAKTLVKAFCVGLGVAKLQSLIKEAVPWPLQNWTKSTLTLGLSGLLAVLLTDDSKSAVLTALGASGIASIGHELQDAMSAFGDNQKSMVAARAGVAIRRN